MASKQVTVRHCAWLWDGWRPGPYELGDRKNVVVVNDWREFRILRSMTTIHMNLC